LKSARFILRARAGCAASCAAGAWVRVAVMSAIEFQSDAARIERHRLAVVGMYQVQRQAELWVLGDFDALSARSGNRRHVGHVRDRQTIDRSVLVLAVLIARSRILVVAALVRTPATTRVFHQLKVLKGQIKNIDLESH
jgi:hypothetical protein